MAYVPLEKLIDKAQFSMFKLVHLVSRRALELADGSAKLIDMPSETKVTTVAMHEVADGMVGMKAAKEKAHEA
jgi:DNA-directed RNA polymerase omega subunit